MIAAERKYESALHAAIAVLLALPFVADLIFPLGTAVWVFYVVPAALAYLASRPQVPLAIAAVATVLLVIGYIFAPSGVDPEVAGVNRILGGLTVWVIAGTCYAFIRTKLAVGRQRWLQAAQVGLAQAMAGEQRVEELASSALNFLANLLQAQAGAFFVVEEDDLRRYGAYGVPGDAPIPERIGRGDTLLARAVAERRSLQLSEVPDGYLYVGSGLGQAKPRHLLISPAAVDGQVNAVIELGFFQPPPEATPELAERVSELIAVAMRSAQYRARLQDLLEETQRQSEELQAQSEELRVANEELETQSRSLRDSQARLETQQAELEQTNAQLEEQTQQLEGQRDELRRAQTALQDQARELEQASRYKSEFVANMSHELRTPLNALLIMARLLAENRAGNLTAEQVTYARTIEISGNDLLALINDILDISKIESGRVELQTGPIRIARILEKLEAAFGEQAKQKGLRLRTEVSAGIPEEIVSDAQRLEQVLRNFLSNAIKFTDQGEVVLGAARDGGGHVALTVRDTGIGIPAEQQRVIFEAFRQADGTINRRYGGTGLGLSISRELARLLGGEIRLESSRGQGSAFTLVIPEIYDPALIRQRDASAAPRPTPAAGGQFIAPPVRHEVTARPRPVEDDRDRLDGESRIILVVEDDAAFARVLYDLGKELGFKCLVAQTADEGVLAARQYMPHAIILDIGLPDHSGLTVLDRLKRDVRTRHIPVHVVSVDDYTQMALSFGAIGYMLKPVKREELVQALERLETRMAQRVRRVLIVEDNPEQLQSLRALLALRDVQTIGATSAAECVERLASETFDCMVLDLALPDRSGLDLLAQLSEDESLAFPPVVVYTGRDLSSDEEILLRRYSKSIIIKGAKSPERLLDEVTLFLHQVVSQLPESQQQMLAKSLNRDAMLDGRRILVVEDDVRNVFALTSVFEPHGASVQIARNGREALDALDQAARDGAAPIDIVLMDVMMPEMDGLTATREIRTRPHLKNLPIIALTAKAGPADHDECIAAGANDYIAKPLDVDKLLSLVRVWMPR